MFKGVGDENNKGKITHPIHSHSKIKIKIDTNTVVDPLTNGTDFFHRKHKEVIQKICLNCTLYHADSDLNYLSEQRKRDVLGRN